MATSAELLAQAKAIVEAGNRVEGELKECILHYVQSRIAHYDGGFFNAYAWGTGGQILSYDDYADQWVVEDTLKDVIAHYDVDLQGDMEAAWL
jgi:hypothetical protein